MLICRHNADLQPSMDTQEDIDWTGDAQSYPNIDEAPSFISQQRQAAGQHVFTTTANPANLQGKQLQVYTIVQQHHSAISPPPLRMLISGTAGTGKSYLIHCLRLLLQNQLCVAGILLTGESYKLSGLMVRAFKGRKYLSIPKDEFKIDDIGLVDDGSTEFDIF